jgi:hypothetical protein
MESFYIIVYDYVCIFVHRSAKRRNTMICSKKQGETRGITTNPLRSMIPDTKESLVFAKSVCANTTIDAHHETSNHKQVQLKYNPVPLKD